MTGRTYWKITEEKIKFSSLITFLSFLSVWPATRPTVFIIIIIITRLHSRASLTRRHFSWAFVTIVDRTSCRDDDVKGEATLVVDINVQVERACRYPTKDYNNNIYSNGNLNISVRVKLLIWELTSE